MKTIIIICIIFNNFWYITETNVSDLNCEYLFFSWQGTEIENKICASEYEKINEETLNWKRQALEARGIY